MKFCNKESVRSPVNHYKDSCEVVYRGRGVETIIDRDKPGYYIKSIKVSFSSFESTQLYLRYRVEYDWNNFVERRPVEVGAIKIDLSGLTSKDDKVVYRLNPYIGFADYPIEIIKQQPSWFDKDTGDFNLGFPSVLSFFSFKLFNIQSYGSMTVGQQFPYFEISDNTDALYNIKQFFNNGILEKLNFGRALSFSISTFMSFGVSDIYPRTSFMKVVCSIQSLLGIMFFGFFVASAYDWIRSGH